MKAWIVIGVVLVVVAIIYGVKVAQKKAVSYPPSSNGLAEAEIIRLENALGKKLPRFYKNFLMNYPDELVKLGAPYNTVSELSLPNKVDRLVEINKDEDPPTNILVIGVNGLGDFYYIILDDNPKKIYELEHDDPSYLDEDGEMIDWQKPWGYSDLNELIEKLKETLGE